MKKGIVQIFFSNIIFMLFGVINNFILPKYLSINSYAMVKTYLLYMSYAGFLGFGFMEGMFLLFGGKNIRETKNLGFGNKFKTFLYIQIFVAIIIAFVGIFVKNSIIIFCSVGLLQTNIINYIKNYATAVGEYKIYSIVNSFEKIGVLLFNIILVFLVKTDDFVSYILAVIAVGILEILYSVFIINNKEKGIFKGKFSLDEAKLNISMGIVLLLSNGISTLFTGIDQWFVKLFMTSFDFAVYSFAVSLERIVGLFITPIILVLYNYLCRNKNSDELKFLREVLLIWGAVILVAIFPVKFFVKMWIAQYEVSLNIIAILFIGQAINCIINGIYTNLYKAEKKQKILLIQMVVMTLLSIILNAVFYYIFKSLLSIAVATLVTKIIWLIWCEVDCKEESYGIYGNISIIIMYGSFLIVDAMNNSVISCAIYCVIIFVTVLIFMRSTLKRCICEIKNLLIYRSV